MARIILESRVRRGSDVAFHELAGDTVLVNLTRGTCFTLDPVGTRIWQLLGEDRALVEVLHVLVSEFDGAEETVTRDLLALVEELAARKLVIVDAAEQ